MRRFANTTYFLPDPFQGYRVLDYENRTIYRWNGWQWEVFLCNRTCMRDVHVTILDEAKGCFI